jgi:hypothetical protein
MQYSTNFKRGNDSIAQQTVYAGNSLKSMRLSIDASLKKLRTDYVDILYVHWWDYNTSVEEVMDGLHNLVVQGKVLYLARRLLRLINGLGLIPTHVLGNFGHTGMGSLQSQHVCSEPWQIALRDIPGCLERHVSPFRTGHYTNGPC